MCFFQMFKNKQTNIDIKSLIIDIDNAILDFDSILSSSQILDKTDFELWETKHSVIINQLPNIRIKKHRKNKLNNEIKEKKLQLSNYIKTIDPIICLHNNNIFVNDLINRINISLTYRENIFSNVREQINKDAKEQWLHNDNELFDTLSTIKMKKYSNTNNYHLLSEKIEIFNKYSLDFEHQMLVHNKNVDALKYIDQINELLTSIKYLLCQNDYIDPTDETLWLNKNVNTLETLFSINCEDFSSTQSYDILKSNLNKLNIAKDNLKRDIIKHNDKVSTVQIPHVKSIIHNVEMHELDQQQLKCIAKDVKNHLVIAGAGTGKTTTIIGKIKYLINTNEYQPNELLVLSFTNASASEMHERIARETGQKIEASTFHKLGINIIKNVEGISPIITKLNLKDLINEKICKLKNDDNYSDLIVDYSIFEHENHKTEFDFFSQKEYDDYLRLHPPKTLDGIKVKSYGELDIANFLFKNNIEYKYEEPYIYDTRTKEYNQYYPDFYLPEYNIYIEYFGINENGEVPSYFKSNFFKSASEEYRKSMEWKRNIHRENSTTLIEFYAYEKYTGTLIQSLKEKLECFGVIFKPKSNIELWKVLNANNNIENSLVDLIETLINLMKSNNYGIDHLKELNKKYNAHSENLIQIIEPLYNAYCHYLSDNKEIDFNDMINLATKYVEEKKYINQYKFVIVDEYQDISKSRYKLLYSLRNSNYFKLFCVGDDWQSIYRFSGSDIGYIVNFEKYWGNSEISKIETTYRFSNQLTNISGYFIMKNPYQIQKNIIGTNSESNVIGEINGYTEAKSVDFMLEKLDYLPKNSTVFFLGRYTYDVKILDDQPLLKCSYDNQNKYIKVIYSKRPDLKMCYLTIHRSKGLQADYVFIINNKSTNMGFPSQIGNHPLVDLLLEDSDQYPYAEERRLFYVALTRAKKKVFVLTSKRDDESIFVSELKEKFYEDFKKEKNECPLCGGTLVWKNGPYGSFIGCSNYRSNGCKYIRNINKKQDDS